MHMFFGEDFSKGLASFQETLKKVPFIRIMGYCFSLRILVFLSKYK